MLPVQLLTSFVAHARKQLEILLTRNFKNLQPWQLSNNLGRRKDRDRAASVRILKRYCRCRILKMYCRKDISQSSWNTSNSEYMSQMSCNVLFQKTYLGSQAQASVISEDFLSTATYVCLSDCVYRQIGEGVQENNTGTLSGILPNI